MRLIKPKLLLFIIALWFSPLLAGQETQTVQEINNTAWNGNWIGEGTLFEIRVEVDNGIMKVHQVESMGFIWTSKDGVIEGNIAWVEVEYAGATGIIQAELVDGETAVAFAASCTPDFMVVCALAKDRQAVFKKITSN